MTLNTSITEQTTAATDLALGIVALVLLILLWHRPVRDPLKRKYWSWMFGFLAVASILGAAAHGLVLSARLHKVIWHVLYLSLGCTVAFFAIGAFHELRGEMASRRLTPWILASALLFYLITAIIPGSFLVFTAYEAIALSGALGIYFYLLFKDRQPAGYLMVAGIAVSMLAAVVQALGKARFTLIWEFNHNGIFHLIQIAGIVLIYRGLSISLRVRTPAIE